jgi:hypothetical protein
MTQSEMLIIDRQLRGINLRLIWALVVCTAVSVATVLSVYYGMRGDIAIQKIQIKLLEARLDRLENNYYNNEKSTSNNSQISNNDITMLSDHTSVHRVQLCSWPVFATR